MSEREQVARGMKVVDRDGKQVGTIGLIGREHFEIYRGFFFPEIHLIAFADVQRVAGETVHLKLPFAALTALWHAQEDFEEPGERRRAIEKARRFARQAGGEAPGGPLV